MRTLDLVTLAALLSAFNIAAGARRQTLSARLTIYPHLFPMDLR